MSNKYNIRNYNRIILRKKLSSSSQKPSVLIKFRSKDNALQPLHIKITIGTSSNFAPSSERTFPPTLSTHCALFSTKPPARECTQNFKFSAVLSLIERAPYSLSLSPSLADKRTMDGRALAKLNKSALAEKRPVRERVCEQNSAKPACAKRSGNCTLLARGEPRNNNVKLTHRSNERAFIFGF